LDEKRRYDSQRREIISLQQEKGVLVEFVDELNKKEEARV